MILRKFFVFLIMFAASAAGVVSAANVYTLAQVPNVHLQDSTRFLSNPDGIISADAQQRIDARLRSLMSGTTAEVVVVAVDDIDADSDIDDFATALFRQWGIGKKDNDNGLLMLIVKDRREVVIRTGYGLEGILPDGVCGSIIRSEITPRFRQGDFDGGVTGAVDAIARIITSPESRDEVLSRQANNAAGHGVDGSALFGYYLYGCVGLSVLMLAGLIVVHSSSSRRSRYDRYQILDRLYTPYLFLSFIGLGMPLIALVPLAVMRRKLRRGAYMCSNCGARMNLVDEVHDNDYLTPAQDTEERINSIDYDVWLCPDCGETEILPYVQRSSDYTECPRCHARACRMVSDRVMRRPTVSTEGIGVRTYQCAHCHHSYHQNYSIARLAPPVIIVGGGGHGGGRGGGFGGGSFGGGFTGGGGARGGW